MISSDWNVINSLKWATAFFKERKIESPQWNAEWLLAHSIGVPRRSCIFNFQRPLEKEEVRRLLKLLTRRLKREPLQYILGTQDFHNITLSVRPGVLIPRPETETLVECALSFLANVKGVAQVLELGTGSGNIPLALMQENPRLEIDCVEISDEAMSVARENFFSHGVERRIRLLKGSLFSPAQVKGKFYDLIISNPPYVPTKEIPRLHPEVCEFEPWIALDGGQQGLDIIGEILRKAARHLRPGGQLMVELGDQQAVTVLSMCRESGVWETFQVLPDLNKIPRVLVCRK